MSSALQRIDPVWIEEFDQMSFGDRKAELIDGVIVVAQAFPTSRHGDIAGGIVTALNNAARAKGMSCRGQVGAGLPIRLTRDYELGPDVLVRCGGTKDAPGVPTLVVEILSPSNRPPELAKKLAAYQSVATVADILLVSQDDYWVEHWSRDADGIWTARIVEGAAATLRLARFETAWRLDELYGDV